MRSKIVIIARIVMALQYSTPGVSHYIREMRSTTPTRHAGNATNKSKGLHSIPNIEYRLQNGAGTELAPVHFAPPMRGAEGLYMTTERYETIDNLLAYANGAISTAEYFADLGNVGLSQREGVTQVEVGEYLAERFRSPEFRIGGKWYE